MTNNLRRRHLRFAPGFAPANRKTCTETLAWPPSSTHGPRCPKRSSNASRRWSGLPSEPAAAPFAIEHPIRAEIETCWARLGLRYRLADAPEPFKVAPSTPRRTPSLVQSRRLTTRVGRGPHYLGGRLRRLVLRRPHRARRSMGWARRPWLEHHSRPRIGHSDRSMAHAARRGQRTHSDNGVGCDLGHGWDICRRAPDSAHVLKRGGRGGAGGRASRMQQIFGAFASP